MSRRVEDTYYFVLWCASFTPSYKGRSKKEELDEVILVLGMGHTPTTGGDIPKSARSIETHQSTSIPQGERDLAAGLVLENNLSSHSCPTPPSFFSFLGK